LTSGTFGRAESIAADCVISARRCGFHQKPIVKMKEIDMTAIVQTLARAFANGEIEVLKHIALLCGAGLLVSLLALTYGLDLSPGFF
jgi:hypothetical protein